MSSCCAISQKKHRASSRYRSVPRPNPAVVRDRVSNDISGAHGTVGVHFIHTTVLVARNKGRDSDAYPLDGGLTVLAVHIVRVSHQIAVMG